MCGPEPLTPTAATLQMRLGSFQNQQQAIHGHEVVDADKHLFANFYVRAADALVEPEAACVPSASHPTATVLLRRRSPRSCP